MSDLLERLKRRPRFQPGGWNNHSLLDCVKVERALALDALALWKSHGYFCDAMQLTDNPNDPEILVNAGKPCSCGYEQARAILKELRDE